MIDFRSPLPGAELAAALAPLCYPDRPDARATEVPFNSGTRWDLCDLTNDHALYPLGPGRWRVGSRYPDRDRYDRWRARLAELGATMEAA